MLVGERLMARPSGQAVSAREAALECLRSLPALAPTSEVLAAAQVQALLHVGDALVAVAGALAGPSEVELTRRQWGPEPAWTANDVVRHCVRGQREYMALLQSPDEDAPGWWHATVLRVERESEASVIVGQGVRLLEGGENNQVMRFPARG